MKTSYMPLWQAIFSMPEHVRVGLETRAMPKKTAAKEMNVSPQYATVLDSLSKLTPNVQQYLHDVKAGNESVVWFARHSWCSDENMNEVVYSCRNERASPATLQAIYDEQRKRQQEEWNIKNPGDHDEREFQVLMGRLIKSMPFMRDYQLRNIIDTFSDAFNVVAAQLDERFANESEPVDDGWQPFETHPNDGTSFMVLWRPSGNITIEFDQHGAGFSGYFERNSWRKDRPTHWMCLPNTDLVFKPDVDVQQSSVAALDVEEE